MFFKIAIIHIIASDCGLKMNTSENCLIVFSITVTYWIRTCCCMCIRKYGSFLFASSIYDYYWALGCSGYGGPILGRTWAPLLAHTYGHIYGPNMGPIWAYIWAHTWAYMRPYLGPWRAHVCPEWDHDWPFMGPHMGPIMGQSWAHQKRPNCSDGP
jgi:hypothetical protein